jgi:TP901-1 family phage major tail protein
MPIQKGSLVLLKISDSLGMFTTTGGMRTTRFILNNQVIDATHKGSGKWRELLDQAGISSVTISGAGIFTDEESGSCARRYAFESSIKNYELCFGNGDRLRGAFQITSYERSGDYNEEETYSIILESSGLVNYVGRGVL